MFTMRLVTALALAAPLSEDLPSPDQRAMHKALSGMHGANCQQVEALSAQPVSDLIWLVEHATRPAWVGMEAARCLLDGHAVEAEAQLASWLVNPEAKGLVILVLSRLDQLPAPLAQRLAQVALEGANTERAVRELLRSDSEALQAQAQEHAEGMR